MESAVYVQGPLKKAAHGSLAAVLSACFPGNRRQGKQNLSDGKCQLQQIWGEERRGGVEERRGGRRGEGEDKLEGIVRVRPAAHPGLVPRPRRAGQPGAWLLEGGGCHPEQGAWSLSRRGEETAKQD